MNIVEIAVQANLITKDKYVLMKPSGEINESALIEFADLIIKQHEAIITDNAKTIANMEAEIAELEALLERKNKLIEAIDIHGQYAKLEAKLAIAIEALERIVLITPYDVKPCRIATEALNKIRSE